MKPVNDQKTIRAWTRAPAGDERSQDFLIELTVGFVAKISRIHFARIHHSLFREDLEAEMMTNAVEFIRCRIQPPNSPNACFYKYMMWIIWGAGMDFIRRETKSRNKDENKPHTLVADMDHIESCNSISSKDLSIEDSIDWLLGHPSLSRSERRVVCALSVSDLSASDAARLLGVSNAFVYSRISSIREKVLRFAQKSGVDPRGKCLEYADFGDVSL